jgi:hypothetical protein
VFAPAVAEAAEAAAASQAVEFVAGFALVLGLFASRRVPFFRKPSLGAPLKPTCPASRKRWEEEQRRTEAAELDASARAR